MEIREETFEEEWTSCKYWHDGKKVKAMVDFKTGKIIDLQGNLLREGIRC